MLNSFTGNDFNAEIVADAPEVYWRLDDLVVNTGDAAINVGATSVSATYIATTTVPVDANSLVRGDFNYAKTFGTDTTARLETSGTPSVFHNTTTGYSFVCLFTPTADDLSGIHVIASRGSRASNTSVYTSGTSIIFQNGTGATLTSTHAALVAGTTYYIACVHEAGAGSQTVRMSVGIVGGTLTTNSTTSAVRDTAGAINQAIGQIAGGAGAEDWHGEIDEVAFFDFDLAQARIDAHYAATQSGIFPTGSGIGRGVYRPSTSTSIGKEFTVIGGQISATLKAAGGIPVNPPLVFATTGKVPDGSEKVYMDQIAADRIAVAIPESNQLIEFTRYGFVRIIS